MFDVSSVGSIALRAIVRTMRKQGRLSEKMSGKDVSLLDSEGCKAAILAAQAAGKVDDSYLANLAEWARKRIGQEPAKGADPALCECGHPEDAHHVHGACADPCDCSEYAPRGAVAINMDAPLDESAVRCGLCGSQLHPGRPCASHNGHAPTGDLTAQLRAGMLALLGDTVQGKAPPLDVDAVKRIVAEAITSAGALRVEVKGPDAVVRTVEGKTHKLFPALVTMVGARVAPMLVGPAGSGKTQACHQAAEALGLKFYCLSVCSQTTASTLLGYMDANGRYVRSLFREAWEHGGEFVLDEIDNGNPNVLAVLNAALSNGLCAFPDGMVQRHADFRLVACANTWGNGRTIDYVGRNPIDAATLDRFVQVAWDYDEKLERDVSGNQEWAIYVQKWRTEIRSRGVKHLVTPRASINGAKLLAAGLPVKDVVAYTLTRGLDESTATAILSNVGKFEVR